MKTSMIRKIYVPSVLMLIVFVSLFIISAAPKSYVVKPSVVTNSGVPVSFAKVSVYDSLKLGNMGLTKDAYEKAVKGLSYLVKEGKISNSDIVSIVDFSLASNKKRLFILDLQNYKILFNTYVAHGRNSGKETANVFSNQDQSFKSSLGFYVTRDTYEGKHGYSLRLDGQEKGINDNALARGIVMHSAWYVSEEVAKSQGFIGRSQGCPAIPENVFKPIIQQIKGGTCLFLYSPANTYVSNSKILKQTS
ncbi:murein L,D-transpeptidase catalytic domain family protein [soil metagenome]